MARRALASTASWVLFAAVAASAALGCGEQGKLEGHKEKLESLGSTMSLVAEAWLAGNVSRAYAVTALKQTQLLVEDERSAFAVDPKALRDPLGAQLSELAERLSRVLAATIYDVATGDAQSVRRRLNEIPIAPIQDK